MQLLHPLGENSPIENFLKKKPEGGMHHICIEVSGALLLFDLSVQIFHMGSPL